MQENKSVLNSTIAASHYKYKYVSDAAICLLPIIDR